MRDSALKNFSRKKRLKTSKDFQQIYQNSQKITGKFFTMLVKPNSLGYSRLGLSISKKRVQDAVERNRLKRIVRESFRHNAPIINLDIVVIANKGSSSVTNQELFENLEKQWKKLTNSQQKV